jgi:hypothetical protein
MSEVVDAHFSGVEGCSVGERGRATGNKERRGPGEWRYLSSAVPRACNAHLVSEAHAVWSKKAAPECRAAAKDLQ